MAKSITAKVANKVAEIHNWIADQSELSSEEKWVLLACLAQIKTAADLENKRLFEVMATESASKVQDHYSVMKAGVDQLFRRNVFVAKTICLASGEKSDRNIRGISFFRCDDQNYKLELSFLVSFSEYIDQLKKEFSS